MAIGRTFEESIQKAMRMTHPTVDGFSHSLPIGKLYEADLEASIKMPSNTRLHAIAKVL